MAIPFQLPSEEDTEARYERLNRLLLQLCDLVTDHFSSNRDVPAGTQIETPFTRNRSARSSSDSTIPLRREGLPDVVAGPSLRRRRLRSARSPPSPAAPSPADDEVFFAALQPLAPAAPRKSSRRKRAPGAPKKALPRRNDSARNTPTTIIDQEEKQHQVQRVRRPVPGKDTTDSLLSPDGSLMGSLLGSGGGGFACAAVVLIVAWRFISNKR